MLLRLLILAVLAALVYRAVKSWLGTVGYRAGGHQTVRPPESVDDVMIQDPVCGTYFARRNAVILRQGNQDHHFCSTACRDRFVAESSKEPNR